jgi:hypothetical protein
MSGETVLSFIENFADAKRTFLYGCCYWFAFILKERFGADIYYNQIDNHFAAKINDRFYDVTGEICGDGFVPWATYQEYDSYDYARIVRDCVDKTELYAED